MKVFVDDKIMSHNRVPEMCTYAGVRMLEYAEATNLEKDQTECSGGHQTSS